MKDAATEKDKKKEQAAEKNKIRRWILKSVSETTPQTAVTLHAIKKFLDSKQSGLSNNLETKLAIKRLTESGHLVKIDGKFADGKNSPKDKQPPAQKRKNGIESKNLAKDSVAGKQPPAQKRKSGSEANNHAESSATPSKRSTEEAKSQESGDLGKTVGKTSLKDKKPSAQKRKSGSELKSVAKSNAAPLTERSSSKEAIPKESETVN